MGVFGPKNAPSYLKLMMALRRRGVYLARALVSPSLLSPLLSTAAPPGGVGACDPRTSPDRTSRRPCFTNHRLTSHYHPAPSDPGPPPTMAFTNAFGSVLD